ncbi:right-handed parallel beta-helix repeat-containing protein [Spirosoma jeollabukense]
MNPFVLLRLGALLLALVVFAHCKPTDPAPDSVVHRVDTMSITQLRTLTASIIPDKVLITDAGREGEFILDEADLTSMDNMGVTLVTVKGHRYKRNFTGPANVFWFGVEPADADIGPELQIAVKATNELMIPDGNYTQLTSVRIRSNLTIQANTGKVLITLPQTYVSFVNAEDPSLPLQHVLFDGLSWNVTSRQTGTYGVIYIDGPTVSDLTVQNCTSSDAAAKDSTNWMTLKIQAGKTATNIVVRNNNVQAKRMACEIFNHDNYNIYAGKNITVSGNNFHDCHFGLSLSGPLTGLTVDNNLIKNCSLFGIEIAGAAQNVAITNNKFEGVFDKFLEGSNDGNGNGTIVGGMIITGNSTVGLCTGGVQLYNAGAATFSKNDFHMSGMLELTHSSAGGMYTENTIESLSNKAVICDNTPNNTFSRNTLSNKGNAENQATFVAYGSKSINNTLTNNKLIKGNGGKPYEAVLGGSLAASMNYDESGAPIP